MLFDLITGNDMSLTKVIIYILSALTVIFLTMPVHEFAHSFAAYKLGDRAQKYSGRLTLNPFAHIAYLGALAILFVGFGWAKPVNVNPYYFRNHKVGMALTALAGPVANLLTAFIAIFFCNLFTFLSFSFSSFAILGYIALFFEFIGSINLGLAVFNLVPLPPLDGSKVLAIILPDRIYYKVMEYERYIYFLLIILLVTDVLTRPINLVTSFIYYAFDLVTALPFIILI